MRIGEFAEKYRVTKDTVRHYIENGLLIPDDRSAHFRFGERECRDMEIILRLKNQQFSLQKIHQYLDILRTSNMTEEESFQALSELLTEKRAELGEKIRLLDQVCAEIDGGLRRLSRSVEAEEPTGVPLRALSLLVCPCCGKALRLERAELDSRYVYAGDLRCRCGYQIKIENGIVKTGNLYTGSYDRPDLKRGLYRNVSENFVSIMQKCTDLTLDYLSGERLRGKVVLESHINGYSFLYNNLRHLEPDCLYIITDKYPEMLEVSKRSIDRLNLGLDILYIADNTMNWPLRRQCVDLLVNYMCDNEHCLYFKTPYITDVDPFVKLKAEVIGIVLGFRKGEVSIRNLQKKYPEGDAHGYFWTQVPHIYEKAGYTFSRQQIGTITKTIKQYSFECFQDGEELLIGHYHARRKSRETPPL